MAHSCILLKDGDRLRRGTLLQLLHDDSYCCHTHTSNAALSTIRCSTNDVAALSKEECVVLDGIGSAANRYTFYSTPGKLKWGSGLKVGDTVLVRVSVMNKQCSSTATQYKLAVAIIRWCGQTDIFGHRFGVEITVSSLSIDIWITQLVC